MKTYVITDASDAKVFSRALTKGLLKPLKSALPFFKVLGQTIDNDVQFQFRNNGVAGGIRSIPQSFKWKPISKNSYGKIRPGTDGSKTRRYDASSKPLQASGNFRKSFSISDVTNNSVTYSTNHKLRKVIGARPFRPVLFVTDKDIERYSKDFKTYIDKGIKFE